MSIKNSVNYSLSVVMLHINDTWSGIIAAFYARHNLAQTNNDEKEKSSKKDHQEDCKEKDFKAPIVFLFSL